MISLLRRWAFVALLALLCMIIAGGAAFGSNASMLEATSGLLIVPPLAFLIDRRLSRTPCRSVRSFDRHATEPESRSPDARHRRQLRTAAWAAPSACASSTPV
jgi:hypothetical protein